MSSVGNICIAVVLGGCATAPSSQAPASAPTYRARPGTIESIAEVDDPVPSDAVDDAYVGLVVGALLLGNLLFHHGTGIVVGAEHETSPGAAPDGGSSKVPHYEVLVRFDDGGSMTLEYRGDVPFARGERVVLTRHGLDRDS